MKLWDILMPKSLAPTDIVGPIDKSKIRKVTGAFTRECSIEEPEQHLEAGVVEVSTLCVRCRERPKTVNAEGKRVMHCVVCIETCSSCGVSPRAVTKKGRRISYCRQCSSLKTKENTEKREQGKAERKGRPPRDVICPACGTEERGAKRLCPRCLKESQRRWRSAWKLRQEELKAKE